MAYTVDDFRREAIKDLLDDVLADPKSLNALLDDVLADPKHRQVLLERLVAEARLRELTLEERLHGLDPDVIEAWLKERRSRDH